MELGIGDDRTVAEISFFAAHVPVGIAVGASPTAATTLAWLTGAAALFVALQGKAQTLAVLLAYLMASEVLWRMSGAAVNWQFAKYVVIISCLVCLATHGSLRPPIVAIIYIVALLPAAWLTASLASWSDARRMLSANLAGPLTLFVATWFFANLVEWDRRGFMRACRIAVAPALAVAVFALVRTLAQDDIYFGRSSLAATSGGFGANQVSAILGLGILLGVFVLALGWRSHVGRLVLIAGLVLVTIQNALTFSRTGLALALLSVAAFAVPYLRATRRRWTVLLTIGVVAGLATFIVIPQLNRVTGGAFSERYTDPDLTGRDDIALTDLAMWRDHPVLGVGVGRSPSLRYRYDYPDAAAHTEYTRLLAEHGLLGLAALVCLGWMFLAPLRESSNGHARSVRAGMLVWAAAFLAVSAFRLATPAILVGMAWSRFRLDAPAGDRA